MRIFNRQGTWRFRSSLIVSAIISTLLVPATLLITAEKALAAPGTFYCTSYGDYPILVNDNGSGAYHVKKLTVPNGSAPSSASLTGSQATLDISNINALGISPVDDKAYGIVSGSKLVRFDDDEVRYVANVEEASTQGTFDVHGDYIYGDGSIFTVFDVQINSPATPLLQIATSLMVMTAV